LLHFIMVNFFHSHFSGTFCYCFEWFSIILFFHLYFLQETAVVSGFGFSHLWFLVFLVGILESNAIIFRTL
ncbi:MAG: hypothetical protein ACK559_32635, partial [bacterium]